MCNASELLQMLQRINTITNNRCPQQHQAPYPQPLQPQQQPLNPQPAPQMQQLQPPNLQQVQQPQPLQQ
uniref:Uncharacterized protein n=1 Tax=Pristionchus pacificus TaxID=54126 RepID=A0A454XS24_PRIPA|eukprot:PDM67601.1 hypothetical protein PRIPAC_49018 [Pristionchus pacificus]